MDQMADEGNRLYSECRADLLKRQLSNSENLDKAVLSLSTAGLGFSLAFIKDVVPLSESSHLCLLYVSWCCFAVAIMITLISFLISQKAIIRQLDYAQEYYLQGNSEALTKVNSWAQWTDKLNFCSAFVFILAIVSTIGFVYSNFDGAKRMQQKKITRENTVTEKGATVPSMQPLLSDVNNGQPIPSLQPLSGPKGSGQQGGGQGQGGNPDAGASGATAEKK